MDGQSTSDRFTIQVAAVWAEVRRGLEGMIAVDLTTRDQSHYDTALRSSHAAAGAAVLATLVVAASAVRVGHAGGPADTALAHLASAVRGNRELQGAYFANWKGDKMVTPSGMVGAQWWDSHFISLDSEFGKSSPSAHLHVRTQDGKIKRVGEYVACHLPAYEFAGEVVRRFVQPAADSQGNRRRIVAVYLDPSNFKNIGSLRGSNATADSIGLRSTLETRLTTEGIRAQTILRLLRRTRSLPSVTWFSAVISSAILPLFESVHERVYLSYWNKNGMSVPRLVHFARRFSGEAKGRMSSTHVNAS